MAVAQNGNAHKARCTMKATPPTTATPTHQASIPPMNGATRAVDEPIGAIRRPIPPR